MHISLPWRDDTGTLSCFAKITVSIHINPLFQSQVWARGLGREKMGKWSDERMERWNMKE